MPGVLDETQVRVTFRLDDLLDVSEHRVQGAPAVQLNCWSDPRVGSVEKRSVQLGVWSLAYVLDVAVRMVAAAKHNPHGRLTRIDGSHDERVHTHRAVEGVGVEVVIRLETDLTPYDGVPVEEQLGGREPLEGLVYALNVECIVFETDRVCPGDGYLDDCPRGVSLVRSFDIASDLPKVDARINMQTLRAAVLEGHDAMVLVGHARYSLRHADLLWRSITSRCGRLARWGKICVVTHIRLSVVRVHEDGAVWLRDGVDVYAVSPSREEWVKLDELVGVWHNGDQEPFGEGLRPVAGVYCNNVVLARDGMVL